MSQSRSRMWFAAVLLSVLVAGCGDGGRDPILGVGGIATLGVSPDTTRPRVTSTQPATTNPGPTTNVPANTAISALFSEEMDRTTILAAGTFTLNCPLCATPNPAGTVSYVIGSRTMVFTPNVVLESPQTYTATITVAAKDVAGNALSGNQPPPPPAASNYVWSFTTVAAVAPTPVTAASTNPAAAAINVCPNATINATFSSSFRMDPATVNATTFTVTAAPGAVPVTATSIVLDDASGRVATFTPQGTLTNGVTYTATIKSGAAGVKDLAVPANQMAADKIWSFTAGPASGNCLAPVPLKTAAPFGIFGGSAGMTNQGIQTVINGDIGTTSTAPTSITGFHDSAPSDVYTETPLNVGTVNGKIYTCTVSTTGPTSAGVNPASCSIATQARADALKAYNDLVALPPGSDPGAGNLANLVLAPGVYTAAAGSFKIQGGDLTLDAQGNTSAVWVFQMSTTLTVGGPGVAFPQSVILINGAQAKNVFWQVGTAATINAAGGGTMVGTIISQAGANFSTAPPPPRTILTLNGRVISLGASVTVIDTVINVPAP